MMKTSHMHFNGMNMFKCFRVLVPAGLASYTFEEGSVNSAFSELSVSPATILKALSFERRHSN